MVTEALNAVLFGSFSWFMLIIFIVLCFSAVLIRKSLGVLMIPVCILFGLEYLAHGLGWHGLILFLTAVFIVIYMAVKKGE